MHFSSCLYLYHTIAYGSAFLVLSSHVFDFDHDLTPMEKVLVWFPLLDYTDYFSSAG